MEEEKEECLPEISERESKFHSADFNCHKCNQTDCCYWVLYNKYYIFEEDTEY